MAHPKVPLSIKNANPHDPARGLSLLWSRLDERFGSAELVESALKNKLNKFPKIAQSQPKRLYDLSDILAEVESIMSYPGYQPLFSYFNTVNKLPPNIQSNWMDRAMAYKSRNAAVHPTFSEFCVFVRQMSTRFNDPSFLVEPDVPQSTPTTGGGGKSVSHGRKQYQSQSVSAMKTSINSSSTKLMCPMHKGADHLLSDCRTLRKMSLWDRKRILRDANVCFKCCDSSSHRPRDCQAVVKCADRGSESHCTVLHVGKSESQQSAHSESQGNEQPQRFANKNAASLLGSPDAHSREEHSHGGENANGGMPQVASSPSSSVSAKCTQVCGLNLKARSCAKIVQVKVYMAEDPSKSKRVYAIMDDQSNGTLARSSLFNSLPSLESEVRNYEFVSCHGRQNRSCRCTSGLVVESLLDGYSLTPTPEITSHFKHLSHLNLPPLDPDVGIELLIGRDISDAHVVLDQSTGPPGEPFAQRLPLGWVVIGNVCLGKTHTPTRMVVAKTHIQDNGRPTYQEPCPYYLHISEKTSDLHNAGIYVFQRSKYDDRPGLSGEDRKFLDIMDRGFEKDDAGHWVAPLPFREPKPLLPSNRSQAIRRANNLSKGLKRNATKREKFVSFMRTCIEKGHAEKAPALNGEESWYLPLFGVQHPRKKKLCVVFDSST